MSVDPPSPAARQEPPLLVAFAPFALWSPHFETDLEIIQDHLDAGGRALVLSCEGQLKTCEPNPKHRTAICAICKRRFRKGIAWLRGSDLQHESFYELTADETVQVELLRRRKWRNLDELRNFTLDGADIGLAAVSSAVSLSREPSPDVHRHEHELGENLASAAMVHFSLRRKLAAIRPDVISLFNGRFAAMRPALRAAQGLGITAMVHERAGEVGRYSLTLNTYPHDVAAVKGAIESTYLQSGQTGPARRAAMDWYEERRAGTTQAWVSFTAAQEPRRLPANLNLDRVNVVIFISSEDEFVAIEEWDNPFYPNQNEGVARLVQDLKAEPDLHFFLRVHPNLAGVRNSQVDGICCLEGISSSLTVISADSPISSYALMDAADVVISYGSTAGIEAAYACKPSILMGRAMYEDLGVCLRPASHEDLVKLLVDCKPGNLPNLPTEYEQGLVKFGHFNRANGIAFQHVIPEGLYGARMRRAGREQRLGSHFPLDFLRKVLNFMDRVRKALIPPTQSHSRRR